MQEQTGVDFWRYVGLFKHWLWLLILAALVGGAAGYGFSRVQVPVYQASTTLLINEAPNTNTGTDYNSLLASERVAQTYAQLLTQRMVLEEVMPTIPYSITTDALKEKIAVSVVRDTQLIKVTVEDTDPKYAAQIANNLALVFADQVQAMQAERYQASKENLQAQMKNVDVQIQDARKELNSLPTTTASKDQRERLDSIISQYQQSYNNLLQTFEQIRFAEAQGSSNVKQVETAVPPSDTIRPRILTNTALAGVVGLLLALGVVLLIEMLDDRLKSPSQIAGEGASALPVLGFIPFFDTSPDQRLPVVAAQPRSPIAERFRVLRTNIQYTSVDHPLHTILITSPAPGDGKTTVAANLAVALAQSGRNVTLVDADLRRPSMHKKLNLANGAGISGLFTQPKLHLNGNLQSTGMPGLAVLTGGSVPPNPAELLGSDKMQDILRMVQAESELVILDSPPVTSVTDAVVMAPRVDGVLLVVRPGETRIGACREALAELQRAGANVLGVVVNGVKADDARYYYSGYYHYYHYYQEEKTQSGLTRLLGQLGFKRHHRRHQSKTTNVVNGVNVDAWIQPEQQKEEEKEPGR